MKNKKEIKDIKKTKSEKKETKKAVKKSDKKIGFFAKTKIFFHEVRLEMKKVKWPTKKDMIKYSLATIVFIIMFGTFFVLTDLIIAGLKVLVA